MIDTNLNVFCPPPPDFCNQGSETQLVRLNRSSTVSPDGTGLHCVNWVYSCRTNSYATYKPTPSGLLFL